MAAKGQKAPYFGSRLEFSLFLDDRPGCATSRLARFFCSDLLVDPLFNMFEEGF